MQKLSRKQIVTSLIAESLMDPRELLDYGQDNGLFSDLCLSLDDVPQQDLERALNHFQEF